MNECELQFKTKLIRQDLDELKNRMRMYQIAIEAASRQEDEESVWYFKVEYLTAYEKYQATLEHLQSNSTIQRIVQSKINEELC